MSKSKKIIVSSLVAIPVLIMVGLLVVYFRLSSIIEHAIETVGPMMTKTELTVGGVNISPFSGSGGMRKLYVGNPEGFKTDSAMELRKIQISLDPKSLLTDTIVINSIHIQKPEITWEGNLRTSNLTQIQKNVDSFTERFTGDQKQKSTKKIIIKDLVIEEAQVNASLTLLGGNDITVSLSKIHMKNIGGKSGASTKEVVGKVIGAITSSTMKAVGNAPDVLKNMGKAAGSVVEGAGDAGKGVVEGVKGFFGK